MNECNCRKPKLGMLNAAKDYSSDQERVLWTNSDGGVTERFCGAVLKIRGERGIKMSELENKLMEHIDLLIE